MRIIGLEEHFCTLEVAEALRALPPEQGDNALILHSPEFISNALADGLGEKRLKAMDAAGVDMMVLSLTSPATQALTPEQAVPLARQANDFLAAAVKAHPDRIAGWATLPTPDPAMAVQELERSVQELGFVGACIHGRTGDDYLDHERFHPILAKAAELNVPIYLHPQIPPQAVRQHLYDGFDQKLSTTFATSGWGWHADAGVGALRLILAGVFDDYPNLQFVMGHWGETVLFFLDRITDMSKMATHLKRPIDEYFRQHFYVGGAGIYSTPYLLRAIEVMGIDRIVSSSDYPYRYFPDGRTRAFIEEAPISWEDKHKIAHGNAEKLLRLKS